MDMSTITSIIICPKCKKKATDKAWTTFAAVDDVLPKVYFQCLSCFYEVEVLDKKLIQFVFKQMNCGYDN